MITAAQYLPKSTIDDDAAAYAHLLLRLHELSLSGQDEGEEADNLRDQMTYHWYRMSAKEQERMRWLSADLYTIEEGGAKSKEMTAEEKREYQDELRQALATDEPDRQLEILRRPYPKSFEPATIPYLQSQAWERLGNPEVTLLFLREAERLSPKEYRAFVTHLLNRLDRKEEAEVYARRLLDDPQSSPVDIYFASSVFRERLQSLSDSEAGRILKRLIPALQRALEVEQSRWQKGRAPERGIELGIALHLGLFLERIGQKKEAIKVYSEQIKHVPSSHELYAILLTSRALANWPPDSPTALSDFQCAIRAGATSVWPYYFLAIHRMRQDQYAEALRLCNFALENTVMPTTVRAEMYRLVAVAYAKLGQSSDWVLQNFELAERLDPDNAAIRADREWYQAAATAKEKAKPRNVSWPSRKEVLEKAWDAIFRRIERQQEQISEHLSAQYQTELLAAPSLPPREKGFS